MLIISSSEKSLIYYEKKRFLSQETYMGKYTTDLKGKSENT